jgi:hypothetical protein
MGNMMMMMMQVDVQCFARLLHTLSDLVPVRPQPAPMTSMAVVI